MGQNSNYFYLWQLITNLFFHGNFFHLILNMYVLYELGRLVEYEIGNIDFVILYLVCGIAGNLSHLLIFYLTGTADIFLIGSSACQYGVLMATVAIMPDMNVMFLSRKILLKYLVIILLSYEIVCSAFGGMCGTAHNAHIGGMIAGYLFCRIRFKIGTT